MSAGQQEFSFYLDVKRGRAITSDDPKFEVSLGRRSKVVYADPANRIEVGADFPPGQVVIFADAVRGRIARTLDGMPLEQYQAMVLARLAAAVAWEDRELVVR